MVVLLTVSHPPVRLPWAYWHNGGKVPRENGSAQSLLRPETGASTSLLPLYWPKHITGQAQREHGRVISDAEPQGHENPGTVCHGDGARKQTSETSLDHVFPATSLSNFLQSPFQVLSFHVPSTLAGTMERKGPTFKEPTA